MRSSARQPSPKTTQTHADAFASLPLKRRRRRPLLPIQTNQWAVQLGTAIAKQAPTVTLLAIGVDVDVGCDECSILLFQLSHHRAAVQPHGGYCSVRHRTVLVLAGLDSPDSVSDE
eukprot:COSAG02_NODE_4979_length_4758_cov_8.253917_3_plen_116_part_00